MGINELFQEAVTNSKLLTEKPNNEVLLKLYSYFKQASEGDATGDGPSNAFDFVAKFKHEAWQSLKGLSKEDAMQKYIDLVNSLRS